MARPGFEARLAELGEREHALLAPALAPGRAVERGAARVSCFECGTTLTDVDHSLPEPFDTSCERCLRRRRKFQAALEAMVSSLRTIEETGILSLPADVPHWPRTGRPDVWRGWPSLWETR